MNRSAVIVTGGSRGIGLAIVEKFVAQGRQVVACGRGVRPRHMDPSVEWVQADVAKTDDATYIVDRAIQRFGRVGVLVNNAGVQIEKTVMESTDADWDEVMGINARGTFNLCRAVLPSMVQCGGVDH
ncbi:SDR family NAD(P)-dependent oxidoreductase [Pseudomonas putida]|uniref:SDR family NAD(P)-dependent oxidoreductase n=1 Tax=Pseudomonas putida TaxID=303 RepID=UPI001C400F99